MPGNGYYKKIIKSIEYKPIKHKGGLIQMTVTGGLNIINTLGKGIWGNGRKK